MPFSHSKLEVYKVAYEYYQWIWVRVERQRCPPDTRSQILRAALSILANISEGNDRWSSKERRRFFEIARASAPECATVQDVLRIANCLSDDECRYGWTLLDRVRAMLHKLGKPDHSR